ncbi:MAG: hypothetical protein ACP5FZ_07940 [Fidelibacterota bacterium]
MIGCTHRATDSNGEKWLDIVSRHLERYPEMEPVDLYKLIYQGTMGPGHLGTDSAEIQKQLEREIAIIEADKQSALIENIAPDSEYVRIHLKKWKSLEYPAETITRAILESNRFSDSDRERLKTAWEIVHREVTTGQISVDKDKFLTIYQHVLENDYPVVHHSERYRSVYSPAYRVVSQSAWKKIARELRHDN